MYKRKREKCRLNPVRALLSSLLAGVMLLSPAGQVSLPAQEVVSGGDAVEGKGETAGGILKRGDAGGVPKKKSGGILPKESKEPGRGKALYDLPPRTGREISVSNALLLDVLVPGGGHFYTDELALGITFAGLKVLGAYSVYYSYKDWKYRRSLYYSARRANQEMDPEHELAYESPDGSYKTEREYKRDYDRAAQRITFSILANVLIYSASLYITYKNVEKINERALPTFEIQYSCATFDTVRERSLAVMCIYRFQP